MDVCHPLLFEFAVDSRRVFQLNLISDVDGLYSTDYILYIRNAIRFSRGKQPTTRLVQVPHGN